MIKKDIVKPCLRWAGGKSWLIKYLSEILGDINVNNYHEPFIGGASVFLSLDIKNESFISDLNKDLIITYQVIKDNIDELIDVLSTYANNKEFYYKTRSATPTIDVERAARFIYLNQTSFNGIYRENLKGEYNVPYGFRKKNFLDKEALLAVNNSLKNARIFHGDFDEIRINIQRNDLVFLDPPYTVAHNENGFIKYNQKIFSWEDQIRLKELVNYINDAGAYYILTNAYHQSIRDLYQNVGNQFVMERHSLIGGKNAKRTPYKEILIKNF